MIVGHRKVKTCQFESGGVCRECSNISTPMGSCISLIQVKGQVPKAGSGPRMGNSQATQNESESELESRTMELTPPPPSPFLNDASAKEVLAILEEFDSIPNLEELAARAKPIQPPPHIVEAMALRGDFDLDLADPDLAPLFEDPPES